MKIEDGNKNKLASYCIPADLLKRFNCAATELGVSRSSLIQEFIEKFLKRYGKRDESSELKSSEELKSFLR